MSIREALLAFFTDDPVNWLKWAVVFAVLIGGYAIAIPLYGRASRAMSFARRRDAAKERGHVVRAVLTDKRPTGDFPHFNWHARYRYTLDGREGRYTAYFKHPATPPAVLYLYYVSDPKRLFSCDEYHYGAHKGLLLLLIVLLPFLLACAALYLLGVERPAA